MTYLLLQLLTSILTFLYINLSCDLSIACALNIILKSQIMLHGVYFVARYILACINIWFEQSKNLN